MSWSSPLAVKSHRYSRAKLCSGMSRRRRSNAEPGFGLPEVFAAIKAIVGRAVPNSDREATLILDFWKRFGPIAREPFLKACEGTRRALGQSRPITAYLDHLERQIAPHQKED